MFNVVVYTDGACSGNPGVGGYGAVLKYGDHEKIVRGFESSITSNNKMELKAVIEAVKALKKPCRVTIHTDSQYLCDCSRHDIKWFQRDNRPNKDMWIELITLGLAGQHKIKFVKVAGHSGDEYNEICDKIAKEECIKAKHELLKG